MTDDNTSSESNKRARRTPGASPSSMAKGYRLTAATGIHKGDREYQQDQVAVIPHPRVSGCVLAVVLFARKRGLPILSLGDVTCAVGPIGLFLGRIANFINGELWGRPTDVPWAMVFPGGGPDPRASWEREEKSARM